VTIARAVDRADAAERAAVAVAADAASRADAAEARTAELEVTIARAVDRADAAERAVADAAARAVDFGKRLQAVTNHLPRSLLLNRDGDLVGIDGEGQQSIIGRVCGEPGVSVEGADVADGRLRLCLSNGRLIDVCAWPEQQEVAPSNEDTEDAILTRLAQNLIASGIAHRKLPGLLKIGRRRLARLLNAVPKNVE
jgi:hypothetical protein